MSSPRQQVSQPSHLRDFAAALFHVAVRAVDPAALVSRYVRLKDDTTHVGLAHTLGSWAGPTLVVGAGKAAAGMAAACERALGDRAAGEVIVTDGCQQDLAHITVTQAGHPLPDERGHQAAKRLLDAVGRARQGGILCLVSGGASSLLVCPRPPVSMADKVATTKLLLECGADIHELNTVRKHLSLVKGGGLLARAGLPVVTLIISDVVGDDPAVIGSGPTIPDPSTFAEAAAVFSKYELLQRLPASVAHLIEAGVAGKVAESLKPTAAAAQLASNEIIASNTLALAAAAAHAREQGWEVVVESDAIVGDTRIAARAFATRVRRHAGRGRRLCLLAGGETTVQVRGNGKGGRNLEFALAIAEDLAGLPVCILSAGTDGIDGPTDAAGAFVDDTTCTRAEQRGLAVSDFLQRNDSYAFFSRLDDAFVCGPTGTNVMDLKIALLP